VPGNRQRIGKCREKYTLRLSVSVVGIMSREVESDLCYYKKLPLS
jgi:hypothetical protein